LRGGNGFRSPVLFPVFSCVIEAFFVVLAGDFPSERSATRALAWRLLSSYAEP
jgi:hypothetical protein